MTEESKLVSFKDLMQAKMERENSAAGGGNANHSSMLADSIKSASLLAENTPELAGLNVKSASKLAGLSKSASRSQSQMLADLRQSKGTRVQVAIRIRQSVKQAIDMFMAKEGMNQQDFFELSASQFIENYEKQLADLNAKGASLLAQDDRRKILYRTTPLIINLYRAYNPGNRWTPKDDEAGVKYNDADLRVVECGIIYTQQNAGYKKIRSFGYYQNEIDEYLSQKLSEQAISYALESSRKFWQSATKREIDLSFLDSATVSK
jgi:hypothetical protein